MATGGKKKLSSSCSVKDSDFVFDFTCNPCEKEGHNKEAFNFCVDCAEYFCLACTKDHQKFRGTSGHNVVNRTLAGKVGGAPQSSGILPNEVCREHHGERITTYCADHDLVLCNTCVSVDHRLCGGVSYIPNVAGGSKQSNDFKRVQHEISESLDEVSEIKLSLQNLLTSADEEKKEHLERIRDCTERLIKHVRDLEKTAVDDVNGCHKTTTDKLRSEVRSLDDAAMSMQGRLKNLDNANVTSESQVFVDIKRGRQEVENVRQLRQNLKSGSAWKAMPEFVVKNDVDNFLNEVRCLGQYAEKKAYTATLYGEYDVRMSEDEKLCFITDSCELPDGSILIADSENICIKKLDNSYKIAERLKMSDCPSKICQTGEDEVAVTIREKGKVQFVNVRGKLRKTRSINVSKGCRGITCSRYELFVSCGGHPGNEYYAPECPGFVGVYSMSGSLLRKIQLDHRGRQIFSLPRAIITTDNGNTLHIADTIGGIVTTDRQGNVLSKFSEGLGGTVGVCAVTDNTLLASGSDSNNVLQIRADGRMVAQLLGEEDGNKELWSILYLRGSSRLVVTQYNSDKIKVYNLKV